MLAQQRVDVQRGANVAGRIDRPDLDMRAVVGGVHLLQVERRDGVHRATRRRIARDAAAELVQLAGQPLLIAFAQEIDLRDDARGVGGVEPQLADVGDQPDGADPHLDLAADLARRCQRVVGVVGIGVERVEVEDDRAGGPCNFEHGADAGPGGFGRRGRHRAAVSLLHRALEPAPVEHLAHKAPLRYPRHLRPKE